MSVRDGRNRRLIRRRTFLGVGGMGAAALILGAGPLTGEKVATQPRFSAYPFSLGIASGDPSPDGVVLWTRLAPDPLSGGGMPNRAIPVEWRVATDEEMKRVVRKGAIIARSELAHSIHVEVEGLEPARWYWYQFRAGSELSPIGRTKTAPASASAVDQLTFALASCQRWVGGPYSAYKNMADEELDLVVHVGDYVYEKGDSRTLADYRNLHALYKSSPDLQAAHAAFPFVVTFDDHELVNNWAGERSWDREAEKEPAFIARRAAAFRAYYEHMPLRSWSVPQGPRMRLYRRLTFGDLAEFNVLDTRQYRNVQAGGGLIAPRHPGSLDQSRTMLGDEQERWLLGGLAGSRTHWNVVAQQTVMAEYGGDPGPKENINHDQWDGYVAARNRLFDFIRRARPSNPVVLSGDWHSSWVNDLKADFANPDSETLATEFVGTSISSKFPEEERRRIESALSENTHVRFFNGGLNGYTRCSLNRQLWRTDFRTVPDARDHKAPASTLASFIVENGRPGARPT